MDTDIYEGKQIVSIRDIGTSLILDELIDLSNQIDIDFLHEYGLAVANKTQKVIPDLILEELDLIPDSAYLKKVFFEERVLNKNSEWVAEHYSNKTGGWFLGRLGLTHPRGHLGQIILIKKFFD